MKTKLSSAWILLVVLAWLLTGVGFAAPIITPTKDDNLAAGLRKLPGNQITYTITIGNTGDATATAVQFTDPDPANTTFVSVNSTPLARADTYAAIGNVQITIPVGSGVLANDNDPDDSVNGAGTLTASAGATSANGGNVSLAANGSFTYNPAPGFTGADTFTYTLTDSEGSTDTGTVTINVTGTIWFINAAAGAGGDGRLTAPFNSVANYLGSAPTKDPGDNIFLYTGTYTGLTLGTNQRLIGQGATSTLATITGLTPPTGSLAFPTTGGTRPTIAVSAGTAVTLGAGNTVNGLNVTNSNGSGITGSAVGTLTLADFDVTVTGGSALSLTTSGTVTATGTNNNLNSTTGTALNVVSVTIGGAGMTFKSISSGNNTAAADPASGIILNNTGAGGLTVTGDGGASNNASGGTIQNTTGVGLSLTTTGPISLGYMNVANSATDGIKGSGINGFTLNRCNVTDAPTGGATDDGVDLSNISGAVSITNCLVDKPPHNCVLVDNFNTNMASFTMTGTTLSNDATSNPPQNDGLLLVMRGNSVLPFGNIQSNTFSGMRAVGVQIQTNDSGRIGANSGGVITAPAASNSIIVQSNTFTKNGQGIDIGTSQVSSLTFQVLSNTITGKVTAPNAISSSASSTAINAFTAAGADTGPGAHTFVGKIDGNIIGTQGVKDSGSGFGNGIRAVVQGQTTQGVLTISNNTIRETPNGALINIIGQNGAATTGTATARFKVTGNNMPAPSGSNLGLCGPLNTACADAGIFVLADEDMPVTNVITGNTIYDVSTMNGSFDIYLAQRDGPPANALLKIEGTGSVSAFTLANNTLAGANKFVDEGAGSGNPSTLVAPGSAGSYPLFLAQGGVESAKSLASGGVEVSTLSASGGIQIPNCPCGCKTRVREALAAARAAEQAKRDVRADSPDALSVATDLAFANGASPRPNVSGRMPATTGGTPTLPGTVRALTQWELDSLVAAALARWAATGLTGEQLATLRRLKFEVADLPGWYLGEAGGERIRVDNNAGGNGWFVDGTPIEDEEFLGVPEGQQILAGGEARNERNHRNQSENGMHPGRGAGISAAPAGAGSRFMPGSGGFARGLASPPANFRSPSGTGNAQLANFGSPSATQNGHPISATRRYTDPAGAPVGRIDLLTALLHEMGHALGLDDTYAEQDRDSLMYGFLTKGERRLPAKNQAAGATPHSETTPHFLGVPLAIGDLPPGKTVTITYVVTINAGTTAISTSSQGTVSGE